MFDLLSARLPPSEVGVKLWTGFLSSLILFLEYDCDDPAYAFPFDAQVCLLILHNFPEEVKD